MYGVEVENVASEIERAKNAEKRAKEKQDTARTSEKSWAILYFDAGNLRVRDFVEKLNVFCMHFPGECVCDAYSTITIRPNFLHFRHAVMSVGDSVRGLRTGKFSLV